MLFTLLSFALALGLLITFHEFGHYYVARLCGVHIERFSIGFGRVLIQKTDKHGTEWALSAIPLGGYVKMQDEAPENACPSIKSTSFATKPLWQRSAIVAAGPLANFLLAVFLYMGLNLIGTQEPAAIVAQPASNTAAAIAGVQGGEHITAVNGKSVQSWNQLRWQLLDPLTSGGTVNIQAETELNVPVEYTLNLSAQSISPDGPDLLEQAGFSLARSRPTISKVLPQSAAEAAGLLPGDVLISINNRKIQDSRQFISNISNNPGNTIDLEIERGSTRLTIPITPSTELNQHNQEIGRIGAMLSVNVAMTMVRYGVLDSVWLSIEKTASTAWFSLKMLVRMVTGQVSVKNISGPVTIADYAGQTARIGLVSYIGFLALISISIGVLNLLPIPMLDGGHLFYYLLEAIRGKPVPDQWMQFGQRIGLALLAALMGLAFFNDLARIFT